MQDQYDSRLMQRIIWSENDLKITLFHVLFPFNCAKKEHPYTSNVALL